MLWPINWKFYPYNSVAIFRFVLITRSILDLTTCAIPLCKALTDGFISSMTPKTSDQVMGTLWPKTWKFHHYNGVAIYRFVLITRSILDVTTCAIPQGKALNRWLHFVYWHLRPLTKLWDVMTHKLKISSLQWCCDISFCPHNFGQF